MVVNKFWVLVLGVKKWKTWNKTKEKYILEERRANLAETDRESYYSQEEWLEFLGNKSAFYNGSESDDSDNDENYHENIDAVVCRCSSK